MVLAVTGAKKINLIGHSRGALDVRYVGAVLPGQVASVTTIGGVNRGDPVADALSDLISIPGIGALSGAILTTAFNAFFSVVDIFSGKAYEQDARPGLLQLITDKINAFNFSYPVGLPATTC